MAPNGILLKWRHSTREEEVRQGEEVIPYMCGLEMDRERSGWSSSSIEWVD